MSTTFQSLQLHPQLQRAIDRLGYQSMTPIQSKILPFTLAGHDAIGRAQTGTGKTAAFLISIINDLLHHPLSQPRFGGEPRALILAPTRELALQIEQDARELLHYCDLKVVTLLGGIDYDKQRKMLTRHFVDILVATPGRLIDFIEQQEIWLDQLEFLVIDEADRMLDMGFIPAVKRIVQHSPGKQYRQTLFFSATFNVDVLNLAYQWLHSPVTIEIEPDQKTNIDVEQRVYMIGNRDKYRLLRHILRTETIEKVIIFANRRDQVRKLYEKLQSDDYQVGILSGDISQEKRSKSLDQFKKGKVNIMIATDVAGRGIHVNGISHVINYTLPEQPDDYVHRIGRTGRAGTQGVSISFLSEDDAFNLPQIEKAIGQTLPLTQIEGF